MKKLITLLLVLFTVLGFSACKTKPENSDNSNDSQTQNETSTETTAIQGDPAEYSMDFWAQKYPGKNICPFYIQEGEVEKPYFLIMEMGSKMNEWINTPFNWNGWHMVGNDIVNKDETLKITSDWLGDDPESAFSSFCTITTEAYSDSGNADGGKTDAGNSSGDIEKTDLTTINGFLTSFGLTEDDLKCANFTRIDKTSQDVDTKQIYQIGVFISEALSEEEANKWLEKVFEKLVSLSDNGKIKNTGVFTSKIEDWSIDFITGDKSKVAGMTMLDGEYTYKGKTVSVTLEVFKGYLDAANPDDAQAACTIKLEYQ